MVEFALILPLLMAFFYGCIELTRYVVIAQKAEKLAFTVADVSSQSKTLSLADLNSLMAATSDIMDPFTMGSNGVVLVTSLYRADAAANATVNWRYSGGGTLSGTSKLGALGATPTMPAGFAFDMKENVIAAEVYYRFTPMLTSQFFGTTTIYRAAFYRPRLGALLTAPA